MCAPFGGELDVFKLDSGARAGRAQRFSAQTLRASGVVVGAALTARSQSPLRARCAINSSRREETKKTEKKKNKKKKNEKQKKKSKKK